MKTRLMNFRVEEPVYEKIKRAAEAAHETVTDFLLGGAALRMREMASSDQVGDPISQAFEQLFRSGKVSPLTPSERAAVKAYEAKKAAGTLKLISSAQVLAEIDAEIKRTEKAIARRSKP